VRKIVIHVEVISINTDAEMLVSLTAQKKGRSHKNILVGFVVHVRIEICRANMNLFHNVVKTF
jgi:cell division GTPase FtsZ